MRNQRDDRHLRIATELTAESPENVRNKFTQQRILVTGDPERLETPSGHLMICVAANLISRFCPKIDIALPAELSQLQEELLTLLGKIDASPDAEFRAIKRPTATAYAAVLSVGAPTEDMEDCTLIDAEGWLAILGRRSSPRKVPVNEDQNPFGALMAAALGAAEVFKDLLEPLRPGKAFHFGSVTFSTFDYSVGGNDPGPNLPAAIVFPDSLLVGVGAVGNAFLLSISAVPGVQGSLIVVDNEHVDDSSNLNRYLLAFEDDADPAHPTPKTELARRLFENSGIQIHPFQESLELFLERLYRREVSRPRIVLSAADNNDARLLLQKLWPDLLVEGATDHTLSQVSRHEYAKGLGCLLCIHDFEAADPQFSYVSHMAEISGLSEQTIRAAMADATMVLSDALLDGVPEENRAFLSKRNGTPLCSVLAEIEALSGRSLETLPTEPAVSFVSMISGLLMAGEYVKYAAGLGSALDTFFNLDSMYPLANAALQTVDKVPTCYCCTRGAEITKYRQSVYGARGVSS